MKKAISFSILVLICYAVGFSQSITTIKPDSFEGKDTQVFDRIPDNNYGDYESILTYVWTFQGGVALKRILIDFDLSIIPTDAIIEKVELSLFHNPSDNVESFDEHTGQNSVIIQKVISDWQEDEVTWNNQPTTTNEEQINLPQSTSPTENYLDIDVTSLFVNIDSSLTENHGLLIKLEEEFDPYKCLLFASSDHPDASLHPELKITWNIQQSTSSTEILNETNIKLFPNPTSGLIEFDIANEKGLILDIEIRNVHGQRIPFILNDNQIMIEQKGIFFIMFSYNEEKVLKKIIVL